MRRYTLLLVVVTLACLTWHAVAMSPYIGYQGVLRDGAGNPVPDGDYSVVFLIYDVEVNGLPIWGETQTVSVEDGIMNVHLGEVTPLSLLAFDVPYWLGIAIEGEPELAPRVEFTTVPYAARAGYSNSSGDDGDWAISGDDVTHDVGRVNIGPPSTAAKLNVLTGDDMGVDISNGSGDGNFSIRARNYGATSGGFYAGITDSPYPDLGTAVYGVGGAGHRGGHFVSRDGEDGVLAESFGGDPALRATAHYDGYSAIFEGGMGVDVQGTAKVVGLEMPSGASLGFVMTSDENGFASWQNPATMGVTGSGTLGYITKYNGPMQIGNSQIFQDGISVGIGTTTPVAGLDVLDWTNNDIAGRFEVVSFEWEAHGVEGLCTGANSVDQTGVYGWSAAQDDFGKGVEGYGGYCGVWGQVDPEGAAAYVGVHGNVIGGYGSNVGVSGRAQEGDTSIGVYGIGLNGTVENWGGWFNGNVNVTGTVFEGAAASRIDHPLDPDNAYLCQAYVESPDMMSVHNGNVVLDGRGEATVEMPDWFEAANRDFRYQLTAIGAPAPNLHIAETLNGSVFRIAGGEPGMQVSWMVTGIRSDRFADANRVVVEKPKRSENVGKLMHPELYGRGDESSVDPIRSSPPRQTGE
jgi:hypothetical protein